MKLTQSVLCYGLVTLAMATLACKKEKKEEVKPAPSVTIDSIPGSARKQAFYGVAGSAITLNYSVKSSENLSKVTVSESSDVSTATVQQPRTKTSDFTTPTTYQSSYSTTFPGSNSTMLTIKVEAADSKNLNSAASFVARRIITDQILGGETAMNASPFYSSLNNKAYSSGDFNANKDKIDITFGYYTPPGGVEGPLLISSDARSQISGVTTGLAGNRTYFKESTLNQAGFNSATALDISKLSASTNQWITIAQEKVYEFVSPTIGSKGLIYVSLFTKAGVGSASTVTFNVKVIN